MSQRSGRGGGGRANVVGTKSQVFPKISFEGLPKWTTFTPLSGRAAQVPPYPGVAFISGRFSTNPSTLYLEVWEKCAFLNIQVGFGCFFYWSALKWQSARPLGNSELFRRDLLCNLTLGTFRGRPVKKTPCRISQKKVVQLCFSLHVRTYKHSNYKTSKKGLSFSTDYLLTALVLYPPARIMVSPSGIPHDRYPYCFNCHEAAPPGRCQNFYCPLTTNLAQNPQFARSDCRPRAGQSCQGGRLEPRPRGLFVANW